MNQFWSGLSALGNSLWLLPATALMIGGGVLSGQLPRPLALRWVLVTAATAVIVLISKLAFIGWGLGSSRLDFTGFSGHAAMSACLYPLLAALLAGSSLPARRLLLVTGIVLAAAIAYSRLPLHAHSVSEVIAGFALGSAALVINLHRWPMDLPRRPLPALIAPAALLLTLVAPPPGISSHQLVVGLATSLSGRPLPYQREWLHRRSAKSLKHQEH